MSSSATANLAMMIESSALQVYISTDVGGKIAQIADLGQVRRSSFLRQNHTPRFRRANVGWMSLSHCALPPSWAFGFPPPARFIPVHRRRTMHKCIRTSSMILLQTLILPSRPGVPRHGQSPSKLESLNENHQCRSSLSTAVKS